MKIFVTGGTGFIGSHFLQQSLAEGHEIIALRRSPNARARIALPREPAWIDKQMVDVTAEDLAGVAVLVHLAAHSANAPYDTVEKCVLWNVIAPLKLFQTAHQSGVMRFVVAGSCFEYGDTAGKYEKIPPDAALAATLSYPASKAAASIVFQAFAKETHTKLSIHRIFHAFGEGEHPGRLWPSLREAAEKGCDYPMTDGNQVRDFVPVEQVARQLLDECLNNHVAAGVPKVRNLGSGTPQTVKKFSFFWWNKWNATGNLNFGAKPHREGEVMRYVPEL